MTNKLERFTQRARRVLSLAQEEAERMRHAYIGTEHLLLGLMREEGGSPGVSCATWVLSSAACRKWSSGSLARAPAAPPP